MISTSKSLDYRSFYTFREPWATRPFRLKDRETAHTLKFEQTNRIARGVEKPPTPLQFDVYKGGEATDILWSQSIHLVCVSERVVVLLEENKITGWSTYPIEIFGQDGDLLPGYFGLAVTGAVCELDRSRSELIDMPSPVPGGKSYQVYRGLYFNENQWDGSDMFWINRAGKIVSDKVYRLFKQHKLTNVKFTPLDEDERETGVDVLT